MSWSVIDKGREVLVGFRVHTERIDHVEIRQDRLSDLKDIFKSSCGDLGKDLKQGHSVRCPCSLFLFER